MASSASVGLGDVMAPTLYEELRSSQRRSS